MTDTQTAPTGRVALVFTDVEGSAALWERDANAMRRALELHDSLLRRLLEEHGGYEVWAVGDAFLVAWQLPEEALRWCLDVQRALAEVERGGSASAPPQPARLGLCGLLGPPSLRCGARGDFGNETAHHLLLTGPSVSPLEEGTECFA